MAASNFRTLEATNRRETAVLVVAFMLLLGALGLGLDIAARDVAIVDGHLVGFPVLTIAALVFAGVQSMVSYYSGASLVLLSVHGRPLTADTPKHQMVLDVINEMATAARMPVPKPYIIDDPSPNAFATGRDPAHSVICVTQGLVDQMDREELQGVIGHEMSHVADYDIRTMMMIAVMVGGIAMLSDFVYRWMFWGGFGGRGQEQQQSRQPGCGADHGRSDRVGGGGADFFTIACDGGFETARISCGCVVGRVHAQSACVTARAGAHRENRVAAEAGHSRHRTSVHRKSARGPPRRQRRILREPVFDPSSAGQAHRKVAGIVRRSRRIRD